MMRTKTFVNLTIFVCCLLPIKACNVDISIDGYDVGGWIVHGGQQFTIERSAYEAKKFTFYRVKKAPKDAGIDPSRTEENGVVKCVFSPEAFVDIPVIISGSPQPLMVRFAPSATVGDLKEEIQNQLNKSPDPNQILALNNKELENHMRVRSVLIYPTVKVRTPLLIVKSTRKAMHLTCNFTLKMTFYLIFSLILVLPFAFMYLNTSCFYALPLVEICILCSYILGCGSRACLLGDKTWRQLICSKIG